MKTVSIGMALLMGLSVTQAGDKPALTFEKIQYVAKNCASSSGFEVWLRSKPGVTKVAGMPIYLTSVPTKNDVAFTMQGKEYYVRVSPDMSARGEVSSISLINDSLNSNHKKYSQRERQEIQYLDKVLAEYETKHNK